MPLSLVIQMRKPRHIKVTSSVRVPWLRRNRFPIQSQDCLRAVAGPPASVYRQCQEEGGWWRMRFIQWKLKKGQHCKSLILFCLLSCCLHTVAYAELECAARAAGGLLVCVSAGEPFIFFLEIRSVRAELWLHPEFTAQTWLASVSQRSTQFCLWSAGSAGVCHHSQSIKKKQTIKDNF